MIASAWTTGRLIVPGGDVLWRSCGDDAKIPLLLIHGGLRGKDTSSKPYELLAPLARDLRLVSWDQLGCGESDAPPSPQKLGMAHYAHEVESVRRALAPGPLHLFGASLGSAFAIEWLLTHKPRDIKSIAFMAPIADGARARSSVRAAQVSAGAAFQRTHIARHGLPPGSGGPPDPVLNRALDAELSVWTRTAELGSLPAPVLFVRGEYDYITEADVTAYAAHCPGSKSATITGAAHLAFIDDPEATCRLLSEFLTTAD